ncbi:MAG: sugar ABC transporter substrate-binding protein [Bifidobacteriaceae bacterium]|nr:sugar ABC transporter substrate-binding protein [Bifidobacteriaceae bacterium]
MRRWCAVLGAATLTAGVAAACSGDDDTATQQSGTVTLTFAASVFGDPGQGDVYRAMLEDFNDTHENIQVATAAIPFERLAPTVTTQMAGGRGPDLIRFDINDFYQIAQDGLVADLTEIDAQALGLDPASDELCLFDSKRYCVVFQTAAHALIYNKDLVAEPPTNFDEFIAAAEGATSGDVYGFAFRTSLAEEPGVWGDLWNWAVGYGGQFSQDGVLTLNDPGIVEGAEAFKEMYDSGAIPKGTTASEYRAMFGEGKLAMEIDSASLVGLLLGMDPELNLGAVPNPFPVRNQNEVFAVLAVNAASPNVAAAQEFVEWWLQESNQTIVQGAVVAGAAAIPAVRSPEDLAEHPYYEVFDELVATSKPGIVVGFEVETPTIRKIVVEEFVAALEADGDMRAAFDRAQQRAEDELGL